MCVCVFRDDICALIGRITHIAYKLKRQFLIHDIDAFLGIVFKARLH